MQNLRNQKYEIIGSYSRGKHKFYKIRFISTGSEKDVRGDILRSGRFKDNYSMFEWQTKTNKRFCILSHR